ncbi:hypothetical protein JWG45_20890 [Leptospira sp. 201903070]|uniref:Uncharacterized protein n=1 Tax=Leptospira ainlahdjerensis TaxID=2810033 RepID=A0ABS2UGU7_9LEPT|nr:hypothetical protein [Leptospira ainlahdjerensis]MBM9579607.1 hypothetical protein [Leptospira ainlahdjerensis]
MTKNIRKIKYSKIQRILLLKQHVLASMSEDGIVKTMELKEILKQSEQTDHFVFDTFRTYTIPIGVS